MQAVGFVEFSTTAGCHILDFSEAAVDSITLVLHLSSIESIAGHQAVGLAVQILQTILQAEKIR